MIFAWLQLDVFYEQTLTGTVSFGLIQGRDDFELNAYSIDESYYTCAFCNVCSSYINHYLLINMYSVVTRYNGTVPLEAFYVIIALLGIGILLSIPTLVLMFVNSYQVVEQWWRGPTTIYMLSLMTGEWQKLCY